MSQDAPTVPASIALSSQNACPISSGDYGYWLDGSTIRFRNSDGTDIVPVGPVNLFFYVRNSPNAYDPQLSGVAASIVSGASSGRMRVSGLSGMSQQYVGLFLKLFGASSSSNNGSFQIASYVNSTTVDVVNAAAVVPDASNGSIGWSTGCASGNDLTGDGSAASPFRTFSKAQSALPTSVRNRNVTINLDCSGIGVEVLSDGYICLPQLASDTMGNTINVPVIPNGSAFTYNTYANPTIQTTLAGTTVQSIDPLNSNITLTDTTQSWTIDQWKGFYVQGSVPGQMAPIRGNNANQIFAPGIGSTFTGPIYIVQLSATLQTNAFTSGAGTLSVLGNAGCQQVYAGFNLLAAGFNRSIVVKSSGVGAAFFACTTNNGITVVTGRFTSFNNCYMSRFAVGAASFIMAGGCFSISGCFLENYDFWISANISALAFNDNYFNNCAGVGNARDFGGRPLGGTHIIVQNSEINAPRVSATAPSTVRGAIFNPAGGRLLALGNRIQSGASDAYQFPGRTSSKIQTSSGQGGVYSQSPTTPLTDSPLTSGATTINVVSTANYPTSGLLKVESEFVSYTGTTPTSFTGCLRGALSSVAAAHAMSLPIALCGIAQTTTVSDSPLSSGATVVNVGSTAGFPSVGNLLVENELIHYTGVTATSFTGLTRGIGGSAAATHASGVTVAYSTLNGGYGVNASDGASVEISSAGAASGFNVSGAQGDILCGSAPVRSYADFVANAPVKNQNDAPQGAFSAPQAYLSAPMGISDTVANLFNAAGLPAVGNVQIGTEIMSYTGVTSSYPFQLTGITRAANGSTAAAHAYGATVLLATASIGAASADTVSFNVTGLVGMSPNDVGGKLFLSNATSAGNNGQFLIVDYISATSVLVRNANGVSADANSGFIVFHKRVATDTHDYARVWQSN